MSLIQVKNLQVNLGHKQILKNINLDIEEGSTTVFIGPSGSGKTTLLRTLNLLQQPTGGELVIDGTTVKAGHVSRKTIKQVRGKSAMVFQQFNLFKNKTVEQNVAAPLIYNGILKKREALRVANETLAKLGLAKVAKQYPVTLSGGQQQRVSIARAITVKPEVILFDEPTSALDPEMVSSVLATIKRLTEENITTVLVTHEMDFAREVADKVVFIENGEILRQGTTAEILENENDRRISKFVNSLRHRGGNQDDRIIDGNFEQSNRTAPLFTPASGSVGQGI